MEPVSITLGLLAAKLIAQLAEKAIDKATDGAVDAGAGATEKLVTWLKSKLSSSREIDLVDQAPDSSRAVTALAEIIDAEIVDEADLAELKALVGHVKQAEPAVYQNARGHHIVQATHSSVNVNWPADPATPPR